MDSWRQVTLWVDTCHPSLGYWADATVHLLTEAKRVACAWVGDQFAGTTVLLVRDQGKLFWQHLASAAALGEDWRRQEEQCILRPSILLTAVWFRKHRYPPGMIRTQHSSKWTWQSLDASQLSIQDVCISPPLHDWKGRRIGEGAGPETCTYSLSGRLAEFGKHQPFLTIREWQGQNQDQLPLTPTWWVSVELPKDHDFPETLACRNLCILDLGVLRNDCFP